VDDDVFSRSCLTRILLGLGLDVALASDGDVACERVTDLRPDFVFMDIEMPRQDGLTATRRIRKLGEGIGGVPVVGVTASNVPEQRCRRAGMGGVLRKPVDIAAVSAALEAAGVTACVPA
jgi:CheY-like chemotaxis protein